MTDIETTYFPLLIEYQDTMEQVVVLSSSCIQSGRVFKVLKTRIVVAKGEKK